MKNALLKITLLSALLAAIITFESCAVQGMPTRAMRFDKTSEKGLIVGSVTFPTDKPKFDGYFFRLTNHTSEEFQIDRAELGPLDRGRTYYFIVERPEGKSEIPSVRLFHNSILIANQYDVRVGGFSIPYEVQKGQITYVGNITFNDYADGGGHIVGLQDKYDFDIAVLKKLKPSVDWSLAKKGDIKIEYNDNKARL